MAQCRKPARLEWVDSGEKLGALCVWFWELGFSLCCVIWARPKISYGPILDIQQVTREWEVIS